MFSTDDVLSAIKYNNQMSNFKWTYPQGHAIMDKGKCLPVKLLALCSPEFNSRNIQMFLSFRASGCRKGIEQDKIIQILLPLLGGKNQVLAISSVGKNMA